MLTLVLAGIEIVLLLGFTAVCPLISFVFVVGHRDNGEIPSILRLKTSENRFDASWKQFLFRLWSRRPLKTLRYTVRFAISFVYYKLQDVFGFSDLFATGVGILIAILLISAFLCGLVTSTGRFGM